MRDDRGTCEIREARLVRDGSLAIGIAIDTSQSLLYTEELRNVVAHRFVETLGPRDTAFLQRFGVTVGHVLDWTTSRKPLEEAVLALGEDPVAGTVLHAAIVDALYQLRGGEGARVLLLVTDGNANGKIVEDVSVTHLPHPPNREVLERFTEATGGRTYVVPSAGGLNDVLANLQRDLRTRYLVSFVANARRTGSFHAVEIRAARGTVRTAVGFFY